MNKLTLSKHGEVVQLRVVDKTSNKVLDTYEFNPHKDMDNNTFYEIADKLGFNYKKHRRYQQIQWQ